MIVIDVLGTPAPKGSTRPMLNRKTGIAFAFAGGTKVNELKLGAWHSGVRHAAVKAIVDLGDAAPDGPLYVDTPLAVEIVFRMARPGSHWAKRGGLKPSAATAPAVKPDIDKLARSTLDSLTGLVFDDDSRIVQLVVRKEYAQPGREGARITVGEATA